MYPSGTKLSEIVTYAVCIEQSKESEPVAERQITPVTSSLQGQHPNTLPLPFLRIPQTNLERPIHQSHECTSLFCERKLEEEENSAEKRPLPLGDLNPEPSCCALAVLTSLLNLQRECVFVYWVSPEVWRPAHRH